MRARQRESAGRAATSLHRQDTTGSGGFTSRRHQQHQCHRQPVSTTPSTTRGEPTGFARWGGAITFDNDGSTAVVFQSPARRQQAMSPIFIPLRSTNSATRLALATSTRNGNALVSGSSFIGINAEKQNNGNAVPLAPDLAHWADGTNSVVYGDRDGARSSDGPRRAERHAQKADGARCGRLARHRLVARSARRPSTATTTTMAIVDAG